MKRLQDKIILVTGASSGIGRACAERSRAEGARVFGLARRGERLVDTCDAWASCDVTDADGVRAAVERCARELGGIDALVNAAGIFLPGGFAEDGPPETSEEIWDRQMRVNVDGVRHARQHPGVDGGSACINDRVLRKLRSDLRLGEVREPVTVM